MKPLYHIAALLLPLFAAAQAPAIYGCTDPLSASYNPSATVNDGSCRYGSATVSVDSTVTLPTAIDETSGLIAFNGSLYTHNDDNDTNLYRLDPQTGKILQTIAIPGVTNNDWEEIAQDADYIYIGDFGNNYSGNRINLNIIRIPKNTLESTPIPDYIQFSYGNQTDFSATANNTTDFDCEAMVVGKDSIYLFTKQWQSQRTSLYRLPKTPGKYVADYQASFDVNGLVTGATYLEDKRLLVLSGYSKLVSPFLYVFYDFPGHDFFMGNKRKISLSASFHQVEGIATTDGINYYLTNEHLQQSPLVNVAQKLHKADLTEYLEGYLNSFTTLPGALGQAGVMIYPYPSGDVLSIQGPESLQGLGYYMQDNVGKRVLEGVLAGADNTIDISTLTNGQYELIIAGFETDVVRIAVK